MFQGYSAQRSALQRALEDIPTQEIAARVAESGTTETVRLLHEYEALIRVGMPMGPGIAPLRRQYADRLIYLLPRLTAEEAAHLTARNRAFLRRALPYGRRRPYTPGPFDVRFVIAALLVLGTAKDRQAAWPARILARSAPNERVRAAAEECLRALGYLSE